MSAQPDLRPLADFIEATYDDPALFITYGLKTHLRTWQAKVCEQYRQQLVAGKTAIKGTLRTCHGSGKTFLVAGLLLHWMTTRYNSRGLTLAPVFSQIESALWPEIEKLHHRSIMRSFGFGRMLNTRIDFGATWFAEGRSSDRPGHLEGQHSDFAAIRLIDEAKEVDPAVFDATDGLLNSPLSCDLWISTPSLESGKFYERDMGPDPDVIRAVITVDDLINDPEMTEAERQGFARWKAERLEEWGPNSAEYQSRVMAQYAENAEGALFPSSWVERAVKADWSVDERDEFGQPHPVMGGMDVAGSVDGDRTAVAIVRGPDAKRRHELLPSMKWWHEQDTTKSRTRATEIAKVHGAFLRIDSIGLGKGVLDGARELGFPAQEYRASDKPMDQERFTNRKAEDAWRVRTLLEQGLLKLPNIQELKADLRGMKYEIKPNGKIHVVDPPKSPDLADALIIALGRSRVGITSASPEWL
ncbi:MAG TPA: hypothetical protein PLB01_00240 [Thermoanaerobaculia bacterium]|nr:hypothetical protein [Thermoanaerobaculia bacterium]